MSGPRALADLDRGRIRAQVDIAAPPEEVFAALTEPAQLAAWWGGEQYRTHDWQLDLRPGGRWSCCATGPGGGSTVGGQILALEPPHLLAYTWNPSWAPGLSTVVRYTLGATPAGGTHLELLHEGFAGRSDACRDHEAGWCRVLGWLAEHAAARPAG
jgi:uncharacterized protein YndB with AHSA1/START domain